MNVNSLDWVCELSLLDPLFTVLVVGGAVVLVALYATHARGGEP